MKFSLFINRFSVFVAGAALAAGAAGFSGTAYAALSFCNKTSGPVEAAVGYRSESRDRTEKWVSEGWWRIEPGQCARVYAGPLSQRFYFYHAQALTEETKDSSPTVWSGKYVFCTDNKAFRVEGDVDCLSRKYRPTGFREIDVGTKTRDYTLDFSDSSGR